LQGVQAVPRVSQPTLALEIGRAVRSKEFDKRFDNNVVVVERTASEAEAGSVGVLNELPCPLIIAVVSAVKCNSPLDQVRVVNGTSVGLAHLDPTYAVEETASTFSIPTRLSSS
jgi:hypothetical protein